MMKKRVYLYAVVAIVVAVAAVITVYYPQFGQGNQPQVIVPANFYVASCPPQYAAFYTKTNFLRVTKNISLYRYNFSRGAFELATSQGNLSEGTFDFVIAPDSTGKITYNVSRILLGGANLSAFGLKTANTLLTTNPANISNHIYLSHMSHTLVNQTITQINATITKHENGTVVYEDLNHTFFGVNLKLIKLQQGGSIINISGNSVITFPNDTKINATKNILIPVSSLPIGTTYILLGYIACYNNGDTCQGYGGIEKPANKINVTYVNLTHIGVNITLQPQYEILYANHSLILNATISVAANAMHGTYLLHTSIDGSQCPGGPFAIITIGNAPYLGVPPHVGVYS